MTATLERPTSADAERAVLQSRIDVLKLEIERLRQSQHRGKVALAGRLVALSRLEGQLAMCEPAAAPNPHE